jgi:hypothetical protein
MELSIAQPFPPSCASGYKADVSHHERQEIIQCIKILLFIPVSVPALLIRYIFLLCNNTKLFVDRSLE